MRLIRVFLLVLAAFIITTSANAYSGNTERLLARLQTYDPDISMKQLESVHGTKNRSLVWALGRIATDLTEDWHVRITAIRALGDTGNPSATDALITNLFDFCPAIRWNTANALAGFNDDPRVVDALIEASQYSDTVYVREAAIRSLGKIGSPKAVPILLRELNSGSFALKSSAIVSLGKIGNAGAVPYLEGIAKHDADETLRSEALAALREIGDKGKNL
jgi:HEAT repeat protein